MGGEYDGVMDIALYENHYFSFDETNFYSNYIRKCTWKKENKNTYPFDSSKLNSLNLVKYMFEEQKTNYFDNFQSEHFKSIYAAQIDKEIVFKGKFKTEKDFRPIKIPKNDKIKNSNVFFADIETTTNGKKHKPYLV